LKGRLGVLTIKVPIGDELYDEGIEQFINSEEFTLELEHSLASLSKWESREEKPFLGKEDKTTDETFAYIRDMVVTQNVPAKVYSCQTTENMEAINNYINAKMTATWFSDLGGPRRGAPEVITSELLYYMLVSYRIPFETQHWHLNKLITLIRVCNEKNKPSKKMPRQTAMQRQREINAARRAKHGTRG
jgi:hypothetical protein